MASSFLENIDMRIEQYKQEHHGAQPLYIVLSPADAEKLTEAARERIDVSGNVLVTEYKDLKIVGHDHVKDGDIRLTNELPDTGS